MSSHRLLSLAETSELIASARVLLIAGDEALLRRLPAGQWIAGTAANVMADAGGQTLHDRLFVTDVTAFARIAKVRTYSADSLSSLAADYFENGFTVIIVPGLSDIHADFAKKVQGYEGVFNAPLYGWISGVAASEIGAKAPKVFAAGSEAFADRAVAMHIALPAGKFAKLDIINLFEQGAGADVEFASEGFETTDGCRIDEASGNLAAYIEANRIDTKLPLVADYNGAMINVSIRDVDAKSGKTTFYAPVFPGVKYRFARPVGEYVAEFGKRLASTPVEHIALSCNCILNYLYAELEGKQTGALVGPITFGEIAYMLLNQTLVYATIEDLPQAA
jgi:Family of unknown function (DUF6976)